MSVYQLGKIAPIIQGNVNESDEYWLLNLDMVESETGRIIGYNYVSRDQIGNSTVSFDTGNVLYSKLRPYLNKVVMPMQDGYATSEMVPLKPDTSIITREYLTYLLRSPVFVSFINSKTSGAKMPRANLGELKKYEIDCPSIEEQRKITSTLDEIVVSIETCVQCLERLDSLKKSHFIEMFGMPGTDVNGWGLVPLGTCCEMNPKKGSDTRLVSGLPVSFVPMPAVSETGDIDVSEVKTYDEVKTGFTYFAENDVLFAKITPCMENGKGTVAVGLKNGIGFGSTEFHVLRPIAAKSDPYWLYTLLSFDSFRKDAAAHMKGSAGQRRVPISYLEDYEVALPPIDLQEQFAAFISTIDKSKVVVQGILDKLKKLQVAMMQEYFG